MAESTKRLRNIDVTRLHNLYRVRDALLRQTETILRNERLKQVRDQIARIYAKYHDKSGNTVPAP